MCVMGGENKQLTVYSNKKIGADICRLENKCKIGDSPEVHPVRWIACNVCRLWYHMFCVELTEPQFQVPRTNTLFSVYTELKAKTNHC